MKVLEARFVTSATDARGIPHDGIPHIALVGRSNVGKSSLLNAMTRVPLARTSAAAGKTRLANLYRVAMEGGPGGPGQWRFYFADLPGYGYARGGRESVAELQKIAEAYFSAGLKTSAGPKTRPTDDAGRDQTDAGRVLRPGGVWIAGILHLVDSRHPGIESDLEAADWISALGVERAVVATKIDKLSRSERTKNLREFERQLGMAALPLSATSGEGLDDLWTLIARLSRQ